MRKYILFALAICAAVACSKDGTTTAEGSKANAVDLGLSVKWADINIGASKPEDPGTYIAWGEYGLKASYTWDNYKFFSDGILTKYNYREDYGTVDNIYTLSAADDAAAKRWGGKWRMPTIEEINELKYSCEWTFTERGGIPGYEVASKVNGNSIFLPAAGQRWGSTLEDVGAIGVYWSSSLWFSEENPDPFCASHLYFDGDREFFDYIYYSSRYAGLSVRPVME